MLTKKFFITIILFFLSTNLVVKADTPYFLDFKYVLNNSDAGKKAQTFLQNKLSKGLENLKKKEKSIQESEKKIIQQKKILSADDYKNKVKEEEKDTQQDSNDFKNLSKSELEKKLNEAIKNEDYEVASKIRDEINRRS